MGLTKFADYINSLWMWGFHSSITFAMTWLFIAGSSQWGLFLNSYFAHCAIVYVICKNVVNRVEAEYKKSGKSLRQERTDWDNGKNRVVLTTLGIVHECLLLALVPQDIMRAGKKD